MRSKALVATLGVAMLVSACGNTVYGPRRLIQAGEFDDGSTGERHCPATPPTSREATPIDLPKHFYDLACSSLRSPNSPEVAREMIDQGVTLTRLRCNDFFAQRMANQMQERVLRGAVTPVSALLTGIIGATSFSTDAERQDAIQILTIGQNATEAGLDLYEREFLFGSDNVNAVRTLTMRALDEHGARILREDVGFYGAQRHLIDHQMICTPANILELSRTAIREGRIAPSTPISRAPVVAGLDGDQAVIRALSRNLRVTELSANQVGALWWLSELVAGGGTISQDTLLVIQDRLSGLPVSPITGSAGSLVVDTALVGSFRSQLQSLSASTTSGFEVARRLLATEIARPAPPAVLDRTKSINFDLPFEATPEVSRSQEVTIAPVVGP